MKLNYHVSVCFVFLIHNLTIRHLDKWTFKSFLQLVIKSRLVVRVVEQECI